MDRAKDLSIVIPNYRERRLMEVYAHCKNIFPTAEIILQDDLDGRGKGWAMREGVKKATRKNICFIDGDMDIHPIEIYKLLYEISEYPVVIGKRIYKVSIGRRILSVGYKVLIYLLFGFAISIDTQCGVKMFQAEWLPDWETDSFAYDIEILAKAINMGCPIKQVPIYCETRKTKSFKAVWDTFVETIKVRKRV